MNCSLSIVNDLTAVIFFAFFISTLACRTLASLEWMSIPNWPKLTSAVHFTLCSQRCFPLATPETHPLSIAHKDVTQQAWKRGRETSLIKLHIFIDDDDDDCPLPSPPFLLSKCTHTYTVNCKHTHKTSAKVWKHGNSLSLFCFPFLPFLLISTLTDRQTEKRGKSKFSPCFCSRCVRVPSLN